MRDCYTFVIEKDGLFLQPDCISFGPLESADIGYHHGVGGLKVGEKKKLVYIDDLCRREIVDPNTIITSKGV